MAMPVVEFSKESYKIRISVRIPWRILRTDGFSFRFFLIVFFTYHVKHKAINANWGSFATFLPHTNVSSVMFQKSSSCVANPDRNRPHPTLIKKLLLLKIIKMFQRCIQYEKYLEINIYSCLKSETLIHIL